MARLKETARLIEAREEASEAIEGLARSEDGEDLSQENASPSDLIGHEKPEPTLRFGTLMVSQNLINFYIDKGYFKEGECRPSKDEDIPNPLEGETVVFRDFFIAGLRFLLDPVLL